MNHPLSRPDITIDEQYVYCHYFDDVYFSKEGGLQETHHVFIQGNQLHKRWSKHISNFTIAETGFGTGLNFLATSHHFLKTAPKNVNLHYISAEKFPLSSVQLKQILTFWPELHYLANQLVNAYPTPMPGTYQLLFDTARIQLTLLLGDAHQHFQSLPSNSVDAWFLDGFTPSKNPDLWSQNLCHEIFRLTKNKGSFATYTVAKDVRTHLTNAGFAIEKLPGFGQKQHMLTGIKHG